MPVFVYDEELRELLAETVERSAFVRIVGALNSNIEQNKEGQKRHSVHIAASNIMTIVKRNRSAAADDGTWSDSSSSSSSEEEDEQVPEAEKQPTRE